MARIFSQSADGDADSLEPGHQRALWVIAAGVVLVMATMMLLGNSATTIAAGCMGVCALAGLWSGASKLIGSFVGAVLGLVLARPLGVACEGAVGAITNTSGMLGRLVSISVVGLVVMLVGGAAASWAVKKSIERRPIVRSADRYAGCVLGWVQGVLVACAVFWGLQALAPFVMPASSGLPREWSGSTSDNGLRTGSAGATPRTQRQASALQVTIGELAQSAEHSAFGSLARAASPVSDGVMQILREFAVVSSNKEAMEHFLASKPLHDLSDSQELMRMLGELREDPELKALLDGGAVTPEAMLALMRNKRILEMLDDPRTGDVVRAKAGEVSLALREAAAVAGRAAAGGPPK